MMSTIFDEKWEIKVIHEKTIQKLVVNCYRENVGFSRAIWKAPLGVKNTHSLFYQKKKKKNKLFN